MSFVQRSLARRILFAVAALVILGVAAMISSISARLAHLVGEEFVYKQVQMSTLLSKQMAPGVRWGKSESIEKIFRPVVGEDSALIRVYVVNADREVIVDYNDGSELAAGIEQFLDSEAFTANETGLFQADQEQRLVVRSRIDDPKKETEVGEAIFVWSEARRAGMVQDVIQTATVFAAAFVALLLVGAHFLIRTQASRPVQTLRNAMANLAEGDIEIEVPHRDRSDEIGAMASAVAIFRDNAVRMRKLNEEKASADEAAEEARREVERQESLAREAAEKVERENKAAAERRAEEERERQEAEEAAKVRREAEERERMEADRRQMMGRLRDAFGTMIDASVRGDFSVRVDADFEDPELSEMANGLNKIAETIAAGLHETCAVLEAVSHRDLSERVVRAYEGEFAALKEGVNLSADTFARIARELQNAVKRLETHKEAVKTGFRDLSERTVAQEASVRKTSSAMALLTESVGHNAQRASLASEKAVVASELATSGGQIILGASKAMDRVLASSGEIASIVDLIDNIAFQTNLLSLNASVEAARAGDAGSGFAVVASEVRKLAQSAASSSAEIRELIDRSRSEIDGGVSLVGKASDQLIKINEGIAEVSHFVEEIKSDVNNQLDKVRNIEFEIGEVSEIAEKNSALVYDSDKYINEMSGEIEELVGMSSSFTIEKKIENHHGDQRRKA